MNWFLYDVNFAFNKLMFKADWILIVPYSIFLKTFVLKKTPKPQMNNTNHKMTLFANTLLSLFITSSIFTYCSRVIKRDKNFHKPTPIKITNKK